VPTKRSNAGGQRWPAEHQTLNHCAQPMGAEHVWGMGMGDGWQQQAARQKLRRSSRRGVWGKGRGQNGMNSLEEVLFIILGKLQLNPTAIKLGIR
jgi:hypothetical protein